VHEQHQIACQSHIVGTIPHMRISYQLQLDIVSIMIFPPLSYHLSFLWLYSLPSNLYIRIIAFGKEKLRGWFQAKNAFTIRFKTKLKATSTKILDLIPNEVLVTFIFGHIEKSLELQGFSVVHHSSNCINENSSINCNDKQ